LLQLERTLFVEDEMMICDEIRKYILINM
jgi:hypothetical protein